MRSELAWLVLLAGCAAHGGDTGTPRPMKRAAPPSRGDAAFVGTEMTSFKPGSNRAVIFTWNSRFPGIVQGPDVAWILDDSLYQKTEDAANAWKVLYYDKERTQVLQVAACEYVSPEAASESYGAVAAKLEARAPLAVPSCEDASVGRLGEDALACARSSRYLFIFHRPRAKEVGEPVVQAIVKACLTEPPPEGDTAPVSSPARNGG